jgi:predicted permease
METLWNDIRFSARALARQPGTALVSVLILGLGIGLCSFMFSIIHGVYFRGLDAPEPDRIALLYGVNTSRPGDEGRGWSIPSQDFVDFRERQRSFEGLAAWWGGTVNISGTEGPERFQGAFVTANSFDLLRVRPVLGRAFREGEDAPDSPPTVILGYDLWQNRYGGDAGVLGRVVKVNGEQGTIVGVMPQGFRWPSNHEVWVTMDDDPLRSARRQGRFYQVWGRLNPAVEWEGAEMEVVAIARQLREEYPEINEDISAELMTAVEAETGPELNALFGAMVVAVVFVLLVACANVANLLLSRAALRIREAGIRVAMGANMLRVVTPFFAEALVLAAGGAVLGTVLAYYSVNAFDLATAPSQTGRPYFMAFTVDFSTLLFVVGLTVVTALVASAAPAIKMARTDVNGILKDESRGSSGLRMGRLTRTLVIVEVALSCALLVGAGLMTKSMVRLGRYELPFEPEAYFTARVGLFETDYPEREDRQRFWEELERRLRADPDLRSVALVSSLPGAGAGQTRIRLEGVTYQEVRDQPDVRTAMVTAGFFELMGAELLQGEGFGLQHTADAERVAVVNRSFAERFWPGESPLGRRFQQGTSDTIPFTTIIGVAPDLQMEGFQSAGDSDVGPEGFYVPVGQLDPSFLSVTALPNSAAPLGLAADVRAAVEGLNPDLPIYDVRALDEVIGRETWFYVVFGLVFVAFGVAALFMASVGLYAVLAFSVTRRIQELGIRMALGAGTTDVLGLVLRQSASQVGIGLAVGLVLAWGVSRVVAIIMFQVEPRDPWVFGGVVGVVVAVGLLASLLPARRATGVDPVVALRYE